MDYAEIVRELRLSYPRGKIYVDKKDNPTEIICELEPASLNPEKSVYVAIIDKTVDHRHRQTKETFEVLKGILIITVDGRGYTLNPGQRFEIVEGQIHFIEGHKTWIKITSIPGWRPQNHILVE